MTLLKLDTENINHLFINQLTINNLLALSEYRVEDAKIQLDTIRVALNNLKLNVALSLNEPKHPNGTSLYNTDALLNTALQLALLKSDEYKALIEQYFKVSKSLIFRQKKCSITYNESLLYDNIIKDYFLDKEQKKLVTENVEV